jgi:RNA polymerase sigma factor (sigma-70 family)
MTAAHPGTVFRPLRNWMKEQTAHQLPDRELLQRFLANQDEAAFTALVQRYGPLVLRVAGRVLRQRQDTEDVFQATFLVLARKAGTIRNQDSLSCWLYGVAHRLAVRLKARISRQRAHILPAGRTPAEPAVEAMALEFCTVLDEELKRLPAQYQAPLLLCGLEGQTRDEAAQQLGWTLGTFKRRLETGRQLLRQRLARRGLISSAALCASLLAPDPTRADLAAGLFARTVKAALALANGSSSAARLVSDQAVALAHGLQRAVVFAKVKTSIALLLLLGTFAVSMGMLRAHKDGSPAVAEEPPATAVVEPNPVRPNAARTVRVVVLDPQGKPLPGANIHASFWTEEKGFKANRDYPTDAARAAQVELPKTFYILRLWASKKPFVAMYAGWEQNELASGKGVPAEYTFRLEPSTTAGGRILDEQGRPIVGAKVQVMISNDPKPHNGDGRMTYDRWLATGSDAATADAEGHWRIANVPNHPHVELSLLVTHPDYVSDQNWQDVQRTAGITTDMLRQGTARLMLKRGVRVRGRVTDPTGKPIKDALVILGDDPYFVNTPTEFPTDAEGRFRLPALPPGETTLTAIATGWAPQLRRVRVQHGVAPQDFQMQPGKPIRLRFVDAAGQPVPNVYVSLRGWKGAKSLTSNFNPNHPKVPDPKIPRSADANGVWNWTWAPDDPVKLEVGLKGFAFRELEIAGGAPERTVTLQGEHRVTGRVTDAVTGRAIPTFTIIPIDVFRKDFLHAERFNAVAGKDGRLSFLATRTDIPQRLRVEAAGYRTQDGPEFRVRVDAARTQDFRLQPSLPLSGMVHDAVGRPAAKVEVLLATSTEQANPTDWHNHRTFTDTTGRFTFPDPGERWAVIAQADAGFALAEFEANQHDAGTLRLRPWASVRGRFRDGGQPVRGATIFVQPVRVDSLAQPRIQATLQTATDTDGGFEFPRVPPESASVRVYLGPWKDEGYRSGPAFPLDLQPGQRAELDLGGAGASVKGKVTLTGKVPADLGCNYSLNYLIRREPGIAPPPAIAHLGFDVRNGWRPSWMKSIEGSTYLSTLQHWFVKLAPDGTFRISGVPPGEYDLAVEVYAKPDG